MPDPRKVFQALRFAVEEVYERLSDGQQLRRHIVRHPGAVIVLPIVDEDHICMIDTYRVAIDRWNLELPAGTLDKPYPVEQMAHLELQEETGYTASQMIHVHTFAMSPGILDERMHFYIAKGLLAGEAQRELGEQIHNQILSWAAVDRLLRDGTIVDAKTLVALLWYMRYREYA